MLSPLASWDSDATWGTFPSGAFHGDIDGIEIQKDTDDLERYRRVVEKTQPEVIVETGTRAGGSAMWFRQELGLDVVTIDLAPQWAYKGGPPTHDPRITWVIGSSIRLD